MGKVIQELFPDKLLEKIGKITEKSINQGEKIEKLIKLLGEHGIKDFDSGTNRTIFRHKKYKEAVIKVAMDEQGILDNLNEYEKSNKSKRFPSSIDIDDSGYVLIQKRWKVIESEDFEKDSTKKEIRKLLDELSEEFVLVDLGMDKRKNFAYDDDGDIGVIDFGYVTYKQFANFNCPLSRKKSSGKTNYCKGKLEYNKNYTMVKCTECGNVFKVDVLIEGHCEHKYDDNGSKKEAFKVTSELQAFYDNFNSYRDRESLTEYVKLNADVNKINIEKGSVRKMDTGKSKFLQMSSRYNNNKPIGKVNYTEGDVDNADEDDTEPLSTNTPLVKTMAREVILKEDKKAKPTFSSLSTVEDEKEALCTYPIDPEPYYAEDNIHQIGHNDDIDAEMIADILDSRKSTIQRMIPAGVDGDEMLSQLYLERFPEMAEIINSQTIITDNNMMNINDYMLAGDIQNTNPYVLINLDNAGEGAFPSVYIIKDGHNLTLDVVPHIDFLMNTVKSSLDSYGDISKLGIISYMYGEALNTFDGNYESRYIPEEIEGNDIPATAVE